MKNAGMVGIAIVAVGVLVAGGVAMYQSRPDRSLARREAAWGVHIQPGDVVLQDLACGLRCNLVRDVTHSRYTQVGVVLEKDGKREVWESFGPVSAVPLENWVDRGKEGRVAVYRPKQVDVAKLDAAVRANAGKPDDTDFSWDDHALYAGELVEKSFERAGTPLVTPHTLAASALAEHEKGIRGLTHGNLTPQLPVVMPVDFTHSDKLTRVVDELTEAP
ncbi:MAG: hypothetical protein JST54_35175 [Deltaproteobacteria bacterium]|nr:hypothetical protein [Deltaproteobacteria bacterium]